MRRPLLSAPAPTAGALVDFQRRSFERFLQPDRAPGERAPEGLHALLARVFPARTRDGLASLEYKSYSLERPKYGLHECEHRGMTWAAPIKLVVWLIFFDAGAAREISDIKEQEVYFGELPLMTEQGTFVVDGRTLALRGERGPRGEEGAAGEALEEACEEGLRDMIEKVVARMEKAAEVRSLMPHDVVNAKPLMTAVRRLFGRAPAIAPLDGLTALGRVDQVRAVIDGGEARPVALGAGDPRAIAEALAPCGDPAAGSRAAPRALLLMEAEAPRVATGWERAVAEAAGATWESPCDAVVHAMLPHAAVLVPDDAAARAPVVVRFAPSTRRRLPGPLAPRTRVAAGERVRAGEVLADGPGVEHGELALGRDTLVLLSAGVAVGTARVSRSAAARLTAIEQVDVEAVARDTRLGAERVAAPAEAQREPCWEALGPEGIARTGAEVREGDALVGIEGTQGSAEGAPPVQWSALRAPAAGRVLGHDYFARRWGLEAAPAWIAQRDAAAAAIEEEQRRVLEAFDALADRYDGDVERAASRQELQWAYEDARQRATRGDEMPPGIRELVRVALEVTRPLAVGDALADRHGGVYTVAAIEDDEAMPCLEDGTRVEVMLPVPEGDGAAGVLPEARAGLAAWRAGERLLIPSSGASAREAAAAYAGEEAEGGGGLVYLYRLAAAPAARPGKSRRGGGSKKKPRSTSADQA